MSDSWGVCRTVSYLARRVREAKAPRDPMDQLLLHLLELMPLYSGIRRLDIWESSVQDAWIEEHSPLEELVDGLFELGRYNLYTAFDTEAVNQELQKVLRLLGSEGIHVEEPLRIEHW